MNYFIQARPRLANSNYNYHFELKESLFILRDNPVLNKNITSVPLQLFG